MSMENCGVVMKRFKHCSVGCTCKNASHRMEAHEFGEYARAKDLEKALDLLKKAINKYPPESHQTRSQKLMINKVRGFFGGLNSI